MVETMFFEIGLMFFEIFPKFEFGLSLLLMLVFLLPQSSAA